MSTIPFLTRGLSKNITESTTIYAKVYAINTAGAFLETRLKNLLETGISHGKNAYERNWCTFQLALLLMEEKADKKSIEAVLSKTVRGNDGTIIIKEEDTLLL